MGLASISVKRRSVSSCHYMSSFGRSPPSPSSDDVIYEQPLRERIMTKQISEFHAHFKPPMQVKATKENSIKCFNTREKTALTCSKAIGELTSELEAKFKMKTRSVNLNSQVRSMGVPLKVFPAEVPSTPNFPNQRMEYRIESSYQRWA